MKKKTSKKPTKAQLARESKRAKAKAWKELSEKLRLEAGRCQMCGSPERLCCHHVLHKKQNPALLLEERDIAVLCAKCHCRLHRGREIEFWLWFEKEFPEKAAFLREFAAA